MCVWLLGVCGTRGQFVFYIIGREGLYDDELSTRSN